MVESLASKKSRTSGMGPAGSMTLIHNMSSSQTSVQPSISASLGKSQSTITGCNHTMLEMAIANFFHCENIPDAAVESPHFSHLLKCARAVGEHLKKK
jgi:hypothetical protein